MSSLSHPNMFSIQVLLFCILVVHVPQCFGDYHLDLSYDVHEKSAHWVNDIPFSRKTIRKGYTSRGYWYESYNFCMSEHTSTHLDAPSHFSEGKWSVEQIPVSHLMGPGVVIDIQHKVAKDSLAQVTGDDIMAWIDEHGELPDGVIVFLRTGWSSKYGNTTAYFGISNNDTSNLNFPGMALEAAQLLTAYKTATGHQVMGVGLDTPSIDYGASTDFHAHIELSSANIFIMENVANLEKLPAKGFHVMVMPMKLRGGSGAPARILASLPDTSAATQITMKVSVISFLSVIMAQIFVYLQSF
ncbi:isatin hydrolase-like [Panulirus ornatus]|uniref:isatin hydrolase-like n=1 Tax=Panulirus ornatus TaxID=150431 RepID=UPI003A84CC7E